MKQQKKSSFTHSQTNCRGDAKNKVYPKTCTVDGLETLKQIAMYDHIFGSFKNAERGNANFISTDALGMDCDNDATENESEWLTPEGLHSRLSGVEDKKNLSIDTAEKRAYNGND